MKTLLYICIPHARPSELSRQWDRKTAKMSPLVLNAIDDVVESLLYESENLYPVFREL